MKSIYQFKNYRAFLQAFYDDKKASSKGYSYAEFSKAARLTSPNYLKLVISGKRNLTVANIHQFARAMALPEHMRDYFESIVLRDQAHSDEEKAYYERRLRKMRSDRPKSGLVARNGAIPFASCYDLAVLVGIHGKSEEAGILFLREQLDLKEREIHSAVARLAKHGLLERASDGISFIARFDHVFFQDKKSTKQDFKSYLRAQLELSQRAFHNGYEKGGKFLSHTFTMDKGSFELFADRLQSFSEKLMVEADDQPIEQIVQLNMQFFPIELARKSPRISG